MRASRFLVALGVILAGVCAAWPFRQSQPRNTAPPAAPIPLELTLRRPDAPLELTPRIDVSPAVGLAEAGDRSRGSGVGGRELADLANLAPPPALPVSFQPSAANSHPNDWRPEPVMPTARPQSPPRPYRLRDGDTLESIAERLLGNGARASEIFEANRGVLARPDVLPVGVMIVLPPRESNGDLEPFAGGR